MFVICLWFFKCLGYDKHLPRLKKKAIRNKILILFAYSISSQLQIRVFALVSQPSYVCIDLFFPNDIVQVRRSLLPLSPNLMQSYCTRGTCFRVEPPTPCLVNQLWFMTLFLSCPRSLKLGSKFALNYYLYSELNSIFDKLRRKKKGYIHIHWDGLQKNFQYSITQPPSCSSRHYTILHRFS